MAGGLVGKVLLGPSKEAGLWFPMDTVNLHAPFMMSGLSGKIR